MKTKLCLFYFLCIFGMYFSQVGIGTYTPHSSSALEIKSEDKGFLPPRIHLNSILDLSTIKNPAEGLIIYEPDGFTDIINNKTINHPKGIYLFKGSQWVHLTETTSENNNDLARNITGVKIRVNQSDFIPISGIQSYGLLLANSGNIINPTYAMGTWPPESHNPTDIISDNRGDNGAILFENPIEGQPNYFRINMEYMIGNNPPQELSYFNIEITSLNTNEVVYTTTILVPGKLFSGQKMPFQVFFPAIPNYESINYGYKIIFKTDINGNTSNNIKIKVIDIERIS